MAACELTATKRSVATCDSITGTAPNSSSDIAELTVAAYTQVFLRIDVVVVQNGDLWKYFLMVRDYLRANPDEVEAYSKAKRETVESGAATFLRYSYRKAPLVKGLAERAKHWNLASMNKLR